MKPLHCMSFNMFLMAATQHHVLMSHVLPAFCGLQVLLHDWYKFHHMTERASKLRRLEDLRRSNPHISASALSELIQDIEKHGVPDLHGRKHVQEAREHTVRMHNAYGPMLCTTPVHCKDGSTKDLLYVNFLTLLQAMFEQGGGMTKLIKTTMATSPCSPQEPWSLIFYSDEVVPGNVLSADTSRKVQCCYVSFLEFGPVALSKEEAWFAILACRSNVVSEVHGGMSQVTACLLEQLLHPENYDPKLGGFVLKDEKNCTIRIFYKLGCFLQDGAAHKAVFSLKGDAGSKFCMFCQTLVTEKSGMQAEDGTDILVANEWDLSKIQQATDQDILGTIARLTLKQKELSKQDFALWQQAVGFNWNPYDLLHHPGLQEDILPISQFLHDYMHCFLVTGIFQTTIWLLLTSLEVAFGSIYPMVEQCLGNWTLPASKKTPLKELFSKKRYTANKKAMTFKCTASEALGLGPILRYWLAVIVIPNAEEWLKQQCNAFLALTDIIDLIQLVPLGCITPGHIHDAVQTFLNLCLKVGWKDFMHSKFHWALHFADHLQKHKQLPSCFVQERKHKVVKSTLALLSISSFCCSAAFVLHMILRSISSLLPCVAYTLNPGYATSISNTLTFEKSVMSEMLCHDLPGLKDPSLFDQHCRLVNRGNPTKAF